MTRKSKRFINKSIISNKIPKTTTFRGRRYNYHSKNYRGWLDAYIKANRLRNKGYKAIVVSVIKVDKPTRDAKPIVFIRGKSKK